MEAKAILRKLHISPRKIKPVADLVRNKEVSAALAVLDHSPRKASVSISLLLRSAIANWKTKHAADAPEGHKLAIKEIYAGSAGMLKRMKPAPRGTAHRIRHRMSHVTIIVAPVPA